MSASMVASVVGIATGINSLTGGGITNALGFGPSSGAAGAGQGGGGAAIADPFAQYRDQYAQQLNALMKDPSSITSQPGYQFQLQQGKNQITAADAASGRAGSGGEKLALDYYGQGFASSFYDKMLNQLGILSGASSGNLGTAGQLQNQQYNAQGQQISQGIGGITTGIQGLYGAMNNYSPGSSNFNNLNSAMAGSTYGAAGSVEQPPGA